MNKSKSMANFGARGWMLIFSNFFTLLVAYMVINHVNSTSSFYAQQGWNPTLLFTSFTVGGLVSVIFQFFAGQLCDKHSPKKLALIFGLIFAAATALYGFVTTMWQFWVIMIITRTCSECWGLMVNYKAVGNWFPRKRGIAMGLITFGIPLGAGVSAIFFMVLGNTAGLKTCFLVLAALSLVAILIQQLFTKDTPEEYGKMPDNEPAPDPAVIAAEQEAFRRGVAESPWTLKRIAGTKEIWFIALALGLLMFSSGFMTQVIPVLSSYGVPEDLASIAMMGVSLVSCFFSWLCGVLDAKIGTKKTIIITQICMIIMAILMQMNSLPCAIAALCFVGMGTGGGSNYLVSICLQYWGRYSFNKAYTLALPICNVMATLGAGVIAAVAEVATYSGSFLLFGVLSAVGLALILLVKDGFVEKREAKFALEDGKKENV